MKKIIILILLVLSCTGCKAANRIYYDMYIASIGLQKTNEGYNGYFYLPSSIDVGNTEKSSEGEAAEVAMVEGETLQGVFSNLDLTTTLKMNLNHISSIVLDDSMVEKGELDKLIDFVKNSNSFDYNFYLFVTDSKIDDIYSLKNPNDESVILSALCDPIANTNIYATIEPPHFLNFCRDYYNNQTVGIPLISSEAIWNEKDDSIYCHGVGFYNRELNLYKKYTDNEFSFLKKHKNFDYSDANIGVRLNDYKINIKYNDSVIKVSSKYEILYSNIDNEEEYLKNIINSSIDKLIIKNDEIDFINLKYNDSINKSYTIEIKLKNKIKKPQKFET